MSDTAHADLVEKQAEKILLLLSPGPFSVRELAHRTGASDDLVAEAIKYLVDQGRVKEVNSTYGSIAYDLASGGRWFQVLQEGDVGGFHAVSKIVDWYRALEISERVAENGRPTRLCEVTVDGDLVRDVTYREISTERPERMERL